VSEPNAVGFRYAVDIVFCIDVTGSMHPVIDEVKANALGFHDRLNGVMGDKGKAIDQLRVRVVAFRDFADRADDALETTGFLTLPDQATDFSAFVHGLRATGGGDAPESGLEALSTAIDSPWEHGFDRRRHVIVMFSDAPAHALGDPRSRAARTHPQSIPSSLDDLFEAWGYPGSQSATMENTAKRLLIFTPDTDPWNVIAADWNNSIFVASKAGAGLEEIEMDEIINAIANSI
jgi:hypothetical protein